MMEGAMVWHSRGDGGAATHRGPEERCWNSAQLQPSAALCKPQPLCFLLLPPSDSPWLQVLRAAGVPCEMVYKIHEGRPNPMDLMK